MAYRQCDVPILLADFGECLKFDGQETRALVDLEGSLLTIDGTPLQVDAGETVFAVDSADLASGGMLEGLTLDANLELDGIMYQYRRREPLDDGALTALFVVKA